MTHELEQKPGHDDERARMVAIEHMGIRKDLTYKFYRRKGDGKVCLILHGGGPAGVESPFISEIFQAIADSRQSVFAFNLPYCERGEASTSDGLAEEVEALAAALEHLRAEGYARILVIAKSLGAIVLSFYLEQKPASALEAIVLGYVIGDVKTAAIKPNLISVIQGGEDRFGNGRAVRREIGPAADITEIPATDHSYRNAEKQPEHQPAVIKMLLEKVEAFRSPTT